MQPKRIAGVLVVGLVCAGCVDLALPSSPPPLANSPRPSTATAAPTIPAGLATRAVAEQDGVRLTIELDHNPMPAGHPTWVSTTVTNTGRDAVVYYPCGEAVVVSGHIAGAPWRAGRELPGPAPTWKTYLLDDLFLEDRVREVLFLPVGQDGSSSGCGDIGHVATLARGASLHERSRWDGLSFRRLAPPPTAPIDLVASFPFDRGDPAVEHPPEDRHLLETHLNTWIAGLPDAFLDPAEAVDIALTDPRLTAVLASQELRNGNGGLVRFDPATGAYQIGLIEENLPTARAHVVFVDARTGRIVGFVERHWDYDVDGPP
jgi:hypothetical protein